jgi:hypothetical protein
MLVLRGSDIVIREAEDGNSLSVLEKVGISSGNEIRGFNAPDTNYVDTVGNEFPMVNDITLVLYARVKNLEPQNQEYLNLDVIKNNYIESEREITQEEIDDPEFNYNDVSYKWTIPVTKQGIILFYLVPLERDAFNNSVYWDTTDQVVRKVVNNVTTTATLEDILELYGENVGVKKCLIFPKIKVFWTNRVIKSINDEILFNKCKDKEKIKFLREVDTTIRNMSHGAINNSLANEDYLAQKKIEWLEEFIEQIDGRV